jgi:hypothetical protein
MQYNLYFSKINIKFSLLLEDLQILDRSMVNIAPKEWRVWPKNIPNVFGVILKHFSQMELWLMLEVTFRWCLHYFNLEESFSTNFSAAALLLLHLELVDLKIQFLITTLKRRRVTDLILWAMTLKILKSAWEEPLIALKIKKPIKNCGKMLLKVLFKLLMLQEVGIMNFIECKTKYTLIGTELKRKFRHLPKEKTNPKRKSKFKCSNWKKESFGEKIGRLKEALKKC